jgi:hypothetical protein
MRGFKEWQERYRVKRMPFLQTWQQAPDPADLYFNSNTIVPRNHHYPPGGLNTSNFLTTTTGVVEMTLAIEQYYPILVSDNADLPSRLLSHPNHLLSPRIWVSGKAVGESVLAARGHMASSYVGRQWV